MPRTQWTDLDTSDKRVLVGLLAALLFVGLAVYGGIRHPGGASDPCRQSYDTQYVLKDQPGGLTYDQYRDREC